MPTINYLCNPNVRVLSHKCYDSMNICLTVPKIVDSAEP